MRGGERDEGMRSLGAAKTVHVIAPDQAPFGIADDAHPRDLIALAKQVDFLRNFFGDPINRRGVEEFQKSAEVDRKNIEAVFAKARFKNRHASASGAESIKKEDRFFAMREVRLSLDLVGLV